MLTWVIYESHFEISDLNHSIMSTKLGAGSYDTRFTFCSQHACIINVHVSVYEDLGPSVSVSLTSSYQRSQVMHIAQYRARKMEPFINKLNKWTISSIFLKQMNRTSIVRNLISLAIAKLIQSYKLNRNQIINCFSKMLQHCLRLVGLFSIRNNSGLWTQRKFSL